MKAIQIITRLIVGGAQRIAIETAAGLRERGIDAEVWCGPQTGPEGSLADWARGRGVPVVLVPALVKEVRPAGDAAALRWLTRRLRAARPDLVHTHSSKAGILGRRAARAARVPAVLHTVHGWGFSERTPLPARSLFIAAERMAAGWARRLIAVSDQVRERGLALGIGEPERYAVIRPGVETAAFADLAAIRARGRELRARLGVPPDAVLAGTIGRLSPQKNPMMILEAAARMPHLHWLLVGDGPLRAEVEERIRRDGLTGRVHLAGLASDVPTCLGALDIFVLTSLWEGLPLTLMEAQLAALPVVAAAVGGVAEVMPPAPSGQGFRAADPAAFREAMAAMLAHGPTAREAALRQRERALARYALARMLAETFALYEEVAGFPLPARAADP